MARMRGEKMGKDLQKPKFKDYDPEDDHDADSSASDESGSEPDQPLTGREHYEKVGKSRLRKPDAPILGAQYDAVAVSRNILQNEEDSDPLAADDDDEDDDPFATANEDSHHSEISDQIAEPAGDAQIDSDLDADVMVDDDDEEIDSDEALGQSDIEKFKSFTFRGSKKNAIPTESQSSLDSEQDLTNSEDDSGQDASDESRSMDGMSAGSDDDEQIQDKDSHDEDLRVRSTNIADPTGRRGELKAELHAQNKALASNLAQAVSDDVAKGHAVKQQYKSLDRLLDSRIKLQKAVTSSEQLSTVEDFGAEADKALKKAEEAATSILASIASLRNTILETQNPTAKKRKWTPQITSTTSTSSIWSSIQSFEAESTATRKTTIDKWSARTRAPGASSTSTVRSHLLGSETSSQQDKLTAILDTYILNEQSKLIPPTDTDAVTAQTQPYDDTTFYQSLLRDLIQSRSSASLSIQPTTDLPVKLHPSGNNASSKKPVDTRASKGRKIRYTVHEKLQNFMAAEGDPWASSGATGVQREWTEEGRREFFASLMGGARVLREDDESEDDTGVDKADEALMLFRR